MTQGRVDYSTVDLSAGNKLYYIITDARTVEIYTNAHNVKEAKDNQNNIISLSIGDYSLNTGDLFQHDYSTLPSAYPINYILKGADDRNFREKYTILTHQRNRCSIYILPVLGNNKDYFAYTTFFINAYLSEDCKQLKVLYRFSTADTYGELEKRLQSIPSFKGIQNYTGGLDLATFNIPEKYHYDVELFLNGKYSKISDDLKSRIKGFHRMKENNRIWQVLTRAPELLQEMLDLYGCTKDHFWNVDLDVKPKKEEEVWTTTIT